MSSFSQCTSEPEWNKCDMMNREEFVVTGLKGNQRTRKTSHVKDLAWALKILIIVLLLLLLFGKLVLVVFIFIGCI